MSSIVGVEPLYRVVPSVSKEIDKPVVYGVMDI